MKHIRGMFLFYNKVLVNFMTYQKQKNQTMLFCGDVTVRYGQIVMYVILLAHHLNCLLKTHSYT